MADPISTRLTAISQKDPRQRTEADMAFLSWCSSGGQGPPPPDDPNDKAAAAAAEQPQQEARTRGPPPKPTADQIERTFKAIVAKPPENRTEEETRFLFGIQQMYQQRKAAAAQNSLSAQLEQKRQMKEQQRQQKRKEAMMHKRRVALQRKSGDKLQSKQHQASNLQGSEISSIRGHSDEDEDKDGKMKMLRDSELVTKSDEPEDLQSNASPVQDVRARSPVPKLKLGSLGISDKSLLSASQLVPLPKNTVPESPADLPSDSATLKDPSRKVIHRANPASDNRKITREQAEKALRSAMSRRLGDNMMSALATKDLRARLVAAMSAGADRALIGRAKKLLLAVQGKKNQENGQALKTNDLESLVQNAKKTARKSGDHARLVADEVEAWESKHLHLMEKAEKQRKIIEKAREEEMRAKELETEAGADAFINDLFGPGQVELSKGEKPLVGINLDQEVVESNVNIIDSGDDITARAPSTPVRSLCPSKVHEPSSAKNSNSDSEKFSEISKGTEREKYDMDSWRGIPKFVKSSRTEGNEDNTQSSPYRSALTLAENSRYSSPTHTEKGALMEESVRETKSILAAEKEAEHSTEKAMKNSNAATNLDDLPAFMLLEDCWNTVQLARTTLLNEKKEKSYEIKGHQKNAKTDDSTVSTSLKFSDTHMSPSNTRDFGISQHREHSGKRRPNPKYTTLAFEEEERLSYSPWHNRVEGGYSGMKDDARAMAIKEEFDDRVARWKNEMPVEERSAQDRGRFCDYLTQHFLANRLDPLPTSELIKSIRTEVAATIERIDEVHVLNLMPKSELAKSAGTGVRENEEAELTVETGFSNKENDADDIGDGIPWKCNVCSKENDGKTSGKCSVCGRPKQTAPLKMAGFLKLKVGTKNEKKAHVHRDQNPNASGLFTSSVARQTGRSKRLDAAARRATNGMMYPAGSGRNAVRQKRKKDSRPPAKFGGRHSNSGILGEHQRRAIGSHAPVDTLGAL